MDNTTLTTDQTTSIHLSAQELRDAQAHGEGFYFPAGSPIPTAAEFAAMVGPCQHPETFRLDEDDPYTGALHGDIQCVECAKVTERASR